jgi:hypothetical protein
MYVADLIQPGTWLELEDREQAHRVEVLIEVLVVKGLDEAAIALHLFRSNGQEPAITREAFLQRMQDSAARRPSAEGLWADRSLSPEERKAAIDRSEIDAEIARNRANWAAGAIPSSYLQALPFMYARMFVYAIDAVVKGLKALVRELTTDLAEKVEEVLKDLDRELPDIVHVRDTAHHHEDRALFRKRGGESVETSAVDLPGFVRAPAGNMLLDSLMGDVYVTTLSDGEVGQVPITEDTLQKLQSAVQGVLDVMPWTGPPQHRPHR